jgi:competence protein ComEC
VWYHFGVFPLYFLLTNLFVIPLAFLVLMLVAVMWSLAPLPLLQQGVAWVLAKVIALMNFVVEGVAALPGASFMLPPIGLFGVICVTVILVLSFIALFQRRWWLLALVSCSIVSLISVYLLYTTPVNKGDYMIIYNNHKNPLLHIVYESGTNYLVSTVPQLDAEYEYVSKPLLQHESLKAPQWVSWEYADSLVQCNEGRFLFNGVVVKMLDNAYWLENEYTEPVDILVLCRGFLGRIDELVEVYPAACVVVDGSLYKHSRKRIKREYARLGIDVVDVTQTGAIKVVAGADGFDLMPVNGK